MQHTHHFKEGAAKPRDFCNDKSILLMHPLKQGAELKGTSPWLGTSSKIVLDKGQALSGLRNCCGPGILCLTAPEPTPCTLGTGALCTGPDIGVVQDTFRGLSSSGSNKEIPHSIGFP